MSAILSSKPSTLVLGAGELGACVLRELALLRNQGQAGPISVLLRPGSRTDPRETGAEAVEADLATATVTALAQVFSRFDQVICCTGFVGGPGTQRKITDAVLKAGIAHYIPGQFGVDYDRIGRGSGQDVWDEQLDVRDMLRGQDQVRWTIISTGIFTSFVFLPAFGLVDLAGNTVRALGDWDYRLTATTPQDIGHLTARIATSRPDFDDQVVFVAGDTFSYRELADTVERVLGRPMRRHCWTVPQLQADAAAHPQDTLRKYRLAFAREHGVAWPKDASFNARQGIAVTDLETWLRQQA